MDASRKMRNMLMEEGKQRTSFGFFYNCACERWAKIVGGISFLRVEACAEEFIAKEVSVLLEKVFGHG
ncbi:hypothetical protein RRG08_041022 [Elysia crispata]|uniref:Uncharacterized protein n=1 Tax=Elysia crispata TaxID=231223 RepID=A0AAE1EE19_9GAST|nr:hypothetical protein RRG08_041022 [Elysia crispata]